ncbi:hypothetical protein L9F63_002863, partial [Diploptera punctata]
AKVFNSGEQIGLQSVHVAGHKEFWTHGHRNLQLCVHQLAGSCGRHSQTVRIKSSVHHLFGCLMSRCHGTRHLTGLDAFKHITSDTQMCYLLLYLS